MKKNGFISTTLIYTFFIIFLLLMVFLLNSYSNIRFLLSEYKYDIKNSFASSGIADINLHIMVWNSNTFEYEIEEEVPRFGYSYENAISYCKNGSVMMYLNGKLKVAAAKKDECYAYFKSLDKDIILNIYTKKSVDSEKVLVKDIPGLSYSLTSSSCTNGAEITFNEETRKFNVISNDKTECEAIFTKNAVNVNLNIYRESATGTHVYGSLKYLKVDGIPNDNYTFHSYTCENNSVTTKITYIDNEIDIESDGENTCNLYFNGGTEKVELIIMQETDTGVSGYTTGKLYSRTYSIPSIGYKYVGYICDDSSASVNIVNGIPIAVSDSQTVCRVYYNKYEGNTHIKYYLEKSDGTYENVSSVPFYGYQYNKEMSSCKNNSTIIVENNITYIDLGSNTEDECSVYFNMVNSDIKVLVYVMNKETGQYELSNIPIAGYNMYNAGCTNGGAIEYINGKFDVYSDGPTVCSVYFR